MEHDLILRAVSGDRDALGRLFAACYGRLTSRVRRRLPAGVAGALAAEDVVQEACLRAVARVGGIRPGGPEAFYAWLTTVVDRRLHDLLKAQRARKRGGAGRTVAPVSSPEADRSGAWPGPVEPPAAPAPDPARREAADAVRRAVARLPDPARRVVELRYLDGLPVAEVARQTGRSPAAVRMVCRRALDALRGTLGPQA
jgi:RNA polymerase sigma-70 factor (ECF subfamily)